MDLKRYVYFHKKMEKEHKKRGRKPKGGKLIETTIQTKQDDVETKQNIILHLKCSIKEIHTPNTFLNSSIEPYNLNKNYGDIQTDTSQITIPINKTFEQQLQQKLKILSYQLHINEPICNGSDCFWCNHSFDTLPVFIPKNKINGIFQVYGSFCCPECAAAFLFKEQIDNTTKYERYHLLNYLYTDAYSYTKNIIPAPSPYYLLNKYYGNLTIEEYRQMLRKDQITLILDKPLCNIYPELFQDNNEYSLPNFNQNKLPEKVFKLCRKSTRIALENALD
jgi:hypothetical protein